MKRPSPILKPRRLPLSRPALALLTTVLLGLALTSRAETKPTNAPAKSDKAPPAAPAAAAPATAAPEPEIPKSVFVVPKSLKEGRDPFFPRSTHVIESGSSVTPTNATPAYDELKLSGISGSPEKPLAIINNVTFGVGDSLTVPISGGRRLPVRCLEINFATGRVLIQVGGERRELHLQTGKNDK